VAHGGDVVHLVESSICFLFGIAFASFLAFGRDASNEEADMPCNVRCGCTDGPLVILFWSLSKRIDGVGVAQNTHITFHTLASC